MHIFNKATAIAVVLFLAANTTNAQSASANISATIVTPITMSRNQDISFGNLAVRDALGGNIVLTPAGNRQSSNGVTLAGNSGTVTAADFTVMGNIDLSYSIQLPTSILLRHSNGLETMTAAAFTSTPSEIGLLTNGGSQHIQIGATLVVGAGQLTGVYTSSAFEVVVSYN